jgi:hypothetical protein
MPSREHAADRERLLTRAAEECEGASAWFGEGLPKALHRALTAAGRPPASGTPEVAFVDVRHLSATGASAPPKLGIRRVVALSDAPLADLPSLIRAAEASTTPVTRLVCPFAVLDFAREGLRVRELRHDLTATDLQHHLDTPLWAGPDLKPMGTG